MTDLERRNSAGIAEQWWHDLTSTDPGHRGTRGGRRAARARLRRAATPLEVMFESEALRLIARLPHENPERVAILAGVLAFVDKSDAQNIARAIGRSSLDDDESAIMSEGRFRRLLQAGGGELMDAMRRLVRLNKGKANVRDLSFAVLRWGDSVKKRWIFDYYCIYESVRQQEPMPESSPASSST